MLPLESYFHDRAAKRGYNVTFCLRGLGYLSEPCCFSVFVQYLQIKGDFYGKDKRDEPARSIKSDAGDHAHQEQLRVQPLYEGQPLL